ncbi:hypothetical protein [Burkholderia pseudomallei]|uniref:hypothetical protein n=1 Tax=Burkholderia pseudomallei TaxID=28450 RepID=UPI0004D1E6AC|nr:hypothetical protein [Burkholderia pseudomallei]AIP51184.1 immunity Imm2 family protein [Burkholderia pseudomallei HBPUB10134a]AIS46645.1 immunity Imm2 family protein [Burkholderia pseudomallei]AJX62447.1 immunity Imm2 family protein [Burkholderia pseudomallei Pasteur 52237]KGD17886.1 immunity Imm2 family protein [Burkholderia pseudomallei]MCD4551611.1 hypothetical protein [Burkholderia pseudomallei]
MLHDERVPYETIKSWALQSYFEGCRDLAIGQGWPHDQIMGYVSSAFEDGFDRDIENLMWNVIIFILSGGMHPDVEDGIKRAILDKIYSIGLNNLLQGVPAEEAELFRHDLRILKFIP